MEFDATNTGERPPDELHGPRFAMIPEWVLAEKPAVVKLYGWLDRYAGATRHLWPGQAELADRMDCSDRTVRTLLNRLEEIGALKEEKRRWNGTTVYTLVPVRPEVSFRSDPTDRKSASALSGSQLPPNDSHEREKKPIARELPQDFQISDEMRAWAREKAQGIDIEEQTELWRDHHQAKGQVFKDWNAAWRKWMRNAALYQAERRATGNGHRPPVDDYERFNQPMPKWGVDREQSA